MDSLFFSKFITSKVIGLSELQVEGLFNIFDRKNRGIVSFADFHSIFNKLGYDKMNGNPSKYQMKDN